MSEQIEHAVGPAGAGAGAVAPWPVGAVAPSSPTGASEPTRSDAPSAAATEYSRAARRTLLLGARPPEPAAEGVPRVSGRRPRILYLAFYFPPTRASGVYRALATANHLDAAGWEVTVCTAPREFFTDYIRSCDPSLEDKVRPGVRVERPGMGFGRWERDVRRFGRVRGNWPVLHSVGRNLLRDRLFPEHYAGWIPRVVSRAVRLHRQRPFDAVLATGNPFSSFAAAWMLGRTLGVPYALDYRDPWAFNPLSEEPSHPEGSAAAVWERRVLRGAAGVVHVNEPIRRWYDRRFPEVAGRSAVVPNGWEPQAVEPLGVPAAAREPGRPLRFGYLGTMTDHLPLEELFEAWRRAREAPGMADAEMHLHGHLGFFPHSAEPLLARMPLGGEQGVRYRGPVAKAEVGRVYREMDVVLFLAGGSTYVTSGKIFEYMATGRPIVSVHRLGIAAADVLAGYPLWFGGDGLAPERLAAALVAAGRAARGQDREQAVAARRHAERYTRDATLGPLERWLRGMAGVAGGLPFGAGQGAGQGGGSSDGGGAGGDGAEGPGVAGPGADGAGGDGDPRDIDGASEPGASGSGGDRTVRRAGVVAGGRREAGASELEAAHG